MAQGKIATAYVQVVPSMDGVAPKVKRYFAGAGDESGSAFGSSMIGKIKGLFAAAGIGKMLSESIMEGGNLQQSLGGVETLFKDSADAVIKNAEQAYKTAGMSANSYMETVTGFSASLLQGLEGDTEKAASVADMALRDMSDNANKMGTDMELIQNAYQGFAKQNYTMLDNLKLGYGGTRTEMQRLLTDAEKLTGIHYDIGNLSDVYSAIHAIQEEMGITGTTAQEASSTIIGSFNSMKAAFSDVLANLALGRDIGPSLNALSETTVTFLAGNLAPAVLNVVQALPGAAVTFIKGVLPSNMKEIVTTGVSQFSSFMSGSLPKILTEGENVVAGLVSGFSAASPDFLQSIQELLSESLTSIISAAPDIIGSGASITENLVSGFVSNVPVFLKNAGQLMIDLLSAVMDAAPGMLINGASLVGNLVGGLISGIPDVISSAADILAEMLATLGEGLPGMLDQGISLMGELVAGLISSIPDVGEAILEIIGNIVNSFLEYDWRSIGSSILSGIGSGIKSAVGVIGEAASSVASSTKTFFRKAYEINSPSKLMRREIGPALPEGIAAGAEDNTKVLIATAEDLADITTDTLAEDLSMDKLSITPVRSMSSSRVVKNTINVYGAEGQNMRDLARILLEEMQALAESEEAAL